MNRALHHEQPKHQKIRFRRAEITDLSAMPSAEGQQTHWQQERRRRRYTRIALFGAGGVAIVFGLLFATATFIVTSDWGTETLRKQAERAIQRIAGDKTVATVGPAHIVFTTAHPIAIEFSNIKLANASTGAIVFSATTVDFGIRLLPLLHGAFQLGSASISDAQINVAAMPMAEARDWTKLLRDDRGLIDPDLVPALVFDALHSAFKAVEAGFADEILLDAIMVNLPETERMRSVLIQEGSLQRAGADSLAISASIEADGRRVTIDGAVSHSAESDTIKSIGLAIVSDGVAEEIAESAAPKTAGSLGGFNIRLSGAEDEQTSARSLRVSGVLEKSALDLGARGVLVGNLQVDAKLVTDSDKIEISKLLLETGRNTLEFNGAFGPRPATAAPDDRPVYRYELVSSKINLAPDGSPEAPINAQAEIDGTFDPETGIIATNRLGIRSGEGEANGAAKVSLVAGRTPGVELSFSVRDFQVAQAKQLWPWFVSPKARAWAYDHLFGGMLSQGHVEFKVVPGRLGNGVPLSAEEIAGRYELVGSRFDTTGALPPVRDATGAVEFRGREVSATLASGTVFLPSGRSVKGTNGTLTVNSANPPPLVGKLDVDVEGDAAALAEFASLDPINALRFVPFSADDLSGTAKGHIISDLPLQKGVDLKSLEWIVALDYSDVAIAKPLNGQAISNATGKMTIEPAQATIAASAKLNGVAAAIQMTEPLRPDGPERQRAYDLLLDDAARKKIVPGLDQIVSGPVKLHVEEKNGVRNFTADLTRARLDLPWAGWGKGSGVAAKATFKMDAAAGSNKISDFVLDGDTFDASGEISLAGGALASARFNKVQLNRGDDVRVKIDKTGKAYRVDVSGDTLDARAMIKRTVSDAKPASGAAARQQDVSLKLSVARVTGFNDEVLSDVRLTSDADGVTIAASSDSGQAVNIENLSTDGAKTLRMQAADAGSILRFLDLYKNMQGGTIKLALASAADGAMAGQVDARNFFLVNEPRLASLVSTTPAGSDRSLNQAVRKDIDVSRVQFERGYAQIARGEGYLRLANGVVRGPQIGTTFQGTLYDQKGQMDMTGTFMPAYGLNRLFGELPLVGVLLGNGRDGGLIGVTFKLDGAAKAPRIQVNPLSVIAPGIFRQIFEFN